MTFQIKKSNVLSYLIVASVGLFNLKFFSLGADVKLIHVTAIIVIAVAFLHGVQKTSIVSLCVLLALPLIGSLILEACRILLSIRRLGISSRRLIPRIWRGGFCGYGGLSLQGGEADVAIHQNKGSQVDLSAVDQSRDVYAFIDVASQSNQIITV